MNDDIIEDYIDHSKNKKASRSSKNINKSFENKLEEPLVTAVDEKKEEKEIKKINNTLVTLIGLVIHSAADGLSFGCASFASTKNNDMEFGLVIFVAIILHKCPAAIGFMSYMMNEEITKIKAVYFLMIFTLSSPIMAMVTYYTLALFTTKKDEHDHTMIYVGVFLFLSAGTFLYVALLHILPEILGEVNKHHDHSKPDEKPNHISRRLQILMLIAGCVSPFMLY